MQAHAWFSTYILQRSARILNDHQALFGHYISKIHTAEGGKLNLS